MNWKLFILQIFIFPGFNAQLPCAFDTTQLLEMTYSIIITDSNKTEIAGLTYLQEKTKDDYDRCETFYIKYIDSAKCYYHYKYVKLPNSSNFGDSLVVAVDMEKVRSLKIEILTPINGNKRVDLSKLKIQKALGLNRIESIEINAYRVIAILINFPKWKIYNSSVAQLSLYSLKINFEFLDKNMLKDIHKFRNLKELKIRKPINEELKDFPQLETAFFSGPLYFFSHQLSSLQHLKYYEEYPYQREYDNGLYSLYAEKNFFLNELDSNLVEHPIFYIDSLIRSNVPTVLNGTGKVYITGNDIFKNDKNKEWENGDKQVMRLDFLGNPHDYDTIASGMIVDGKMAGIWKYQIGSYHYYDHSPRSKIQFPYNGNWQYHYYNGTVAIEGKFKDGKKSGTWRFYDLNGEITTIKTFKKDKPYGMFINIIAPDLSAFYKGPDSKNNIKIIKYGKIIKVIPKDSRRYKRLMQKYEIVEPNIK